jgi:hypothetical protein
MSELPATETEPSHCIIHSHIGALVVGSTVGASFAQ